MAREQIEGWELIEGHRTQGQIKGPADVVAVAAFLAVDTTDVVAAICARPNVERRGLLRACFGAGHLQAPRALHARMPNADILKVRPCDHLGLDRRFAWDDLHRTALDCSGCFRLDRIGLHWILVGSEWQARPGWLSHVSK